MVRLKIPIELNLSHGDGRLAEHGIPVIVLEQTMVFL